MLTCGKRILGESASLSHPHPETRCFGDVWGNFRGSQRRLSRNFRTITRAGTGYRPLRTKRTPTVEELSGNGELIRLGQATYVVPTDQLLSDAGEEIFLRAQSAKVLKFLTERLDRLVPRDDLIAEVWPNLAVTDDSLTQCIADIRRALGDTGRTILKTIPKRGYTLLGSPVNVRGFAEKAQPFERDRDEPEITPQLDPRDILPTLAVLPFRAQQPGDTEIFGVFFANEIAKTLCLTEDLNVVSRLSTGTLGGALPDVEDIGQRLNADFVLSGFIIRRGDQFAVSLEFAETETGYVLWTDRVQTAFDPMSPETEGVDLIIGHIRRAIMLNEVRRVASRKLNDLKLFSLLHGSVGLMHRLSPRDFNTAGALLDHLVNRAMNHPTPLAWLARWHVLKAVQGWTSDPRKGAEAALELTARALDLDPGHTHALVCEGQALVHLARRLDDAEERYDMALATNPNDANGRVLRGMLRSFTDRGDEGRRDTERALHLTSLDPHRFFYLALASGSCIAVEDYGRAVVLAKESLRLNRTHVSTLRMLAVAQLGAGDGDAGRKTAAGLLAQQPSLRVSSWLKSSPAAGYAIGDRFAKMLRDLGVPE